MFDLVPLAGAGRVVTNRDGDPQLICQLLQLKLPPSQAISIAPSPIRTNQQPLGLRIPLASGQPPPPANARHRELGGFMGHPHTHHGLVVGLVISPIGNPFAFRPRGEIIGVHALRPALPPPRAPRIFKGSDELYVRNTNRNWLTLLARSDEKVEEAGCCNARRGANL